jgi:hypothetical protein
MAAIRTPRHAQSLRSHLRRTPFEAFGATLLPIMAEAGVEPGQPMVAPVRNIIKG